MTTYDGLTTPADWICSSCHQPRAAHTCLGGFTRKHHDFVAMLRIRNEERWIAEVIESVMPLCDRIFIMDDHSTDGTLEVCLRYPKVTVFCSPFEGLNEARDKNWLLDQIMRECEASWVLCIDGDEVLERNGPDIIRETIAALKPGIRMYKRLDDDKLRQQIAFQEDLLRRGIDPSGEPELDLEAAHKAIVGLKGELARRKRPESKYAEPVNAFALQVAFLWDSRDTVRVDRIYGDFWRPSLFRPFYPDPAKPDDVKIARELRFMSTPFGKTVDGNPPNLHCSSVPQRFIHGRKLCPARLKHLGYMWRPDRVKKLDYYTSIDWQNRAEDCYRHMTQGDSVLFSELRKTLELMNRGILQPDDLAFLVNTPAEATLVHAGPLKVVPWDEDKPWPVSEWARIEHA